MAESDPRMPPGGTPSAPAHFDVLIVGAGLSGIGAAWYLQQQCPDRSYAILEGRGAIGGTWDLFRYPGIRSDSDMYTLGYAFRPWTQAKAIADGPAILQYVRDTALEAGIDRRIRFHHQVKRAWWSSEQALWTVEAKRGDSGEIETLTCNWLHMCSGYYDYAHGHQPDFPGRERFGGEFVHPQFWPEQLDYSGKRVVVIGSGATAVTLVPEMAKTAAHVTMLQRSPTYVVSRPAKDGFANWLRTRLPAKIAYDVVRWRNVLIQLLFFQLARRRPDYTKKQILKGVTQALGADYDVARHFTPSYKPWDQRLCLIPDSDLFEAIKGGRASVVTDTIDELTEDGIRLASGDELKADVIVSATGLKVQLMGDMQVHVDGNAVRLNEAMTYKGLMFSDIPNLSYSFGYTNASWTLKADLTCAFVCRLLNHLRKRGCAIAVAERDSAVPEIPFLNFTSGYIQRAADVLPKQGATKPWRLNQNYAFDMAALKFGKLEDGVMKFKGCGARAVEKAA
jgi:cation diffusion facilitator CzcD-associated flavoprotein CzcO